MLGMASCTRGGNADRGNGGMIGNHNGRHEESTTYSTDGDTDTRRGYNDDGMDGDINNIPRDIRRGIDRAGDDIRDGLDDAGNDIRNGADSARDGIMNQMPNNGTLR